MGALFLFLLVAWTCRVVGGRAGPGDVCAECLGKGDYPTCGDKCCRRCKEGSDKCCCLHTRKCKCVDSTGL